MHPPAGSVYVLIQLTHFHNVTEKYGFIFHYDSNLTLLQWAVTVKLYTVNCSLATMCTATESTAEILFIYTEDLSSGLTDMYSQI